MHFFGKNHTKKCTSSRKMDSCFPDVNFAPFSGKSALFPGCSKNKWYIHPSGKSALLPGKFLGFFFSFLFLGDKSSVPYILLVSNIFVSGPSHRLMLRSTLAFSSPLKLWPGKESDGRTNLTLTIFDLPRNVPISHLFTAPSLGALISARGYR